MGFFFLIDVNYAKGAEGLCELTSVFSGGTGRKQANAPPPGESPAQQALPLLLLGGKGTFKPEQVFNYSQPLKSIWTVQVHLTGWDRSGFTVVHMENSVIINN